MKRKMRLGELPGHFRKLLDGSLEGRINQANSALMVPEKSDSDVGQAMYKINDTCGVCCAVHIADQARTPKHERRVDDIEVRNGAEDFEADLVGPIDLLHDRVHVKVRLYQDGVLSLFKTLLHSRPFRDWLRWNSLVNRENWHMVSWLAIVKVMEKYMHEKCGAPQHCFDDNDWPDGIGYDRAFQKLVDLNPQAADRPLASLKEHEMFSSRPNGDAYLYAN